MGRFSVGETVEWWSPTNKAWEPVQIASERAPGELERDTVYEVVDPRDGKPTPVPGIFLRRVVSADAGRAFPRLTAPLTPFELIHTHFPEGEDDDGDYTIVVEIENTNTGEVRGYTVILGEAEYDAGRVTAQLGWAFGKDDQEAACNVNCRNPNCGTETLMNHLAALSRWSAKVTSGVHKYLTQEPGATWAGVIPFMYPHLKGSAEYVLNDAFADLGAQLAEPSGQGEGGIEAVIRALQANGAEVQIISLDDLPGESEDDGGKAG